MSDAAGLDVVNRRAYASPGAIRQYGRAAGWLDAGEHLAVRRALPWLEDGRVLDIGIGGGRTVPLLGLLSSSYVGIDYTSGLVAVARQRFPDYDLREMDARKLDFPDETFRLVMFSFNGLDSVDETGREQILREAWRVLKPGGALVFSSLNRDGSAFGQMPWTREPHWRGIAGLLRRARRTAVGFWRVCRHRSMIRDRGDHALAPLAVHDFGVMAMFMTPAAQTRHLEELGFRVEAVLEDATGAEVDTKTPHSCAPWLYYVARRPIAVPVAANENPVVLASAGGAAG